MPVKLTKTKPTKKTAKKSNAAKKSTAVKKPTAKKKKATPKAAPQKRDRELEAKEAQLLEALKFRQTGISVAQTSAALGISKSEQDKVIGRFVLVSFVEELKAVYRESIFFGQPIPDFIIDACRFYANALRKISKYQKPAKSSPLQQQHEQISRITIQEVVEELLKSN